MLVVKGTHWTVSFIAPPISCCGLSIFHFPSTKHITDTNSIIVRIILFGFIFYSVVWCSSKEEKRKNKSFWERVTQECEGIFFLLEFNRSHFISFLIFHSRSVGSVWCGWIKYFVGIVQELITCVDKEMSIVLEIIIKDKNESLLFLQIKQP